MERIYFLTIVSLLALGFMWLLDKCLDKKIRQYEKEKRDARHNNNLFRR
jgi:hypothetical protein